MLKPILCPNILQWLILPRTYQTGKFAWIGKSVLTFVVESQPNIDFICEKNNISVRERARNWNSVKQISELKVYEWWVGSVGRALSSFWLQARRTASTRRSRTSPGLSTLDPPARGQTPASTSAGTGRPAWPSWTIRRLWRTSCRDICSGSSKTPTDGRNSGWSSPTFVSTSTKHFKMTFLLPVYLYWATMLRPPPQVIISVRTTCSSSSSRTTSTSSELRVSSLLTG